MLITRLLLRLAPRLAHARRRPARWALVFLLGLLLDGYFPNTPAIAQTCTTQDFAAAVDRAGAQLRDFNATNGPKVAAALKELQKKRGWSDRQLENEAIRFLHSSRIGQLDEQANELLSKIDMLGEVDEKTLDCSRLPELQRAGRDLLLTMREKAELTQANIAAAMRNREVAARRPEDARPAEPKPPKPARQAKPPAGAPAPSARVLPKREGSWDAATQRAPDTASRSAGDVDVSALRAPQAGAEAEPGYTIDEIKAATRGFFGTISTNLAGVIEYAFSNYGRPSAYVLGSEGGGAFLAGARFGKGMLFMRSGGQRDVYWHGPSLGYDFGAEGSRTLFLIYRLKAADGLFRRYGGVDGSAYVLGGVGLTILKGGPVVMAPIRTGVGLRLGANIGYVRFTPHATWNPF